MATSRRVRAAQRLGRDRRSGSVPTERMFLIQFYKVVAELDAGKAKRVDFVKFARELTNLSQPNWVEERNFVSVIWNDEFYIARHEHSTTI